MRNKVIAGIALTIMTLGLTGCGNMDLWDTEYTFDYAECYYGGQYKKIEIRQWTDYDGEQIQIKGKDNKVYLVSANNCVLVKED